MRLIDVGPSTTLRIPDAWTCFTYRGFVYYFDDVSRFVCYGRYVEKPPTAS